MKLSTVLVLGAVGAAGLWWWRRRNTTDSPLNPIATVASRDDGRTTRDNRSPTS